MSSELGVKWSGIIHAEDMQREGEERDRGHKDVNEKEEEEEERNRVRERKRFSVIINKSNMIVLCLMNNALLTARQCVHLAVLIFYTLQMLENTHY